MKAVLSTINLIYALLFVAAFGGIFALNYGLPIVPVLGCLLLFSMLMPGKQTGVLNASILKQVWTGEVLSFITKSLNASFLDGITDYSKYVARVNDEVQAINIADMGVLPEVLINNTTYPIGYQNLDFVPKTIELDKFQTKATPITDDELYASSVKKMDVVKDRHGKAIMITMYKKAIHSFAPASNTAKMPVLVTTGELVNGRRRLVGEDLLTFKTALDDLEIDNRRLVLCNDHVNDLIAQDKEFKALYYNRTTGKISNMLDFDIYDYAGNPYFNPATKAKLSFGAVPAATDRRASVMFSTDRAAKAIGWNKMYVDLPDTQQQRSAVNFRQYGIYLPTAEEARGAIVSANG